MDFPPESFDIIWAEGSIFVIGFSKGLQAWKRFLKPEGYLVVHDAVGNLHQKLRDVIRSGYQLMEYFLLENEVWWKTYYGPLSQELDRIIQQQPKNHEIKTALKQAEEEIQGYSTHPEQYQSVYFILQNGEPSQ